MRRIFFMIALLAMANAFARPAKTTEKASAKSPEARTAKASEKQPSKASAKTPEKASEKTSAKTPEKTEKTEKTADKPSDKASAKSKKVPTDTLPDLEHERVDYWVAAFSKMHDYHKKIAAGFERKAKYQDMIEKKLRKKGMPQNLIYLAFEESAFNPAAGSRRAAVGIWQLTAATARLYGLKVNKKHDERLVVEKETDAALRFLSHLHKRFGCWYLAAAAYDSGENRVARLMRKKFGREKGRDRDYYRLWDDLPGETRDYVPAIIALKRIGSNPSKYGF